MKSKLIFIGLCASLFVLSCNRDNQVNIEQAKNYINEHAKYTPETVPVAKSATLKWDFEYTEEEVAKRAFASGVQQYLNDGEASYAKSGERSVKNSRIEELCRNNYLSKKQGETLVSSDKVYINNTGIKIVTTYTETSYETTYTTQWDSECKILSSESNTTYENYNLYRLFTFSY